MVKYCPGKLRGKLVHAIKDKLNTLILHQFAAEVIEQIYLTSPSQDKRDIVISFYGSHFLLLKQNIQVSLKDLIVEKAKALEGIQGKIEGIATKLIDKGLIRHTIVQAILWDFYQIVDLEKQKEIASLLQENLPALLTSLEGLKVAAGVFTICNAKERKNIVKLLKGNIKELAKNEIASLFLLKVLLCYDDTVTAKKYIVNDLVTNFEELIQDDPEKIVE